MTGIPASAIALAEPPVEMSSYPRATRPLARSARPVLSETEIKAYRKEKERRNIGGVSEK